MRNAIPITDKWQGTSSAASASITAPSQGYLRLKSLNVVSDAACTITVQSPSGTTLWTTQLGAGGGVSDHKWSDDDGILGAEASAMVIAVSAGTYTISYTGETIG